MSTSASLNKDDREHVAAADLYRAVWRWHFYAGMLVLPFMILLAATGMLYLFHDEIESVWYRDLRQVAEHDAAPRAPETLAAAALAAQPGTLLKY
ncbi:PepSY domain-containing protein, partial [Bordetella avium]